jgi:YidC/Oxa1 family membrane protein insertase
MNPFQLFFTYFIWQPQINILRLTYELTHEIGFAIILLAIILNIPIWYLYFKSFLSTQKQRALAPKMKAIQLKYKEEPLEMRKQLMEFNKKHGINNSATFYMIVFQLFFITVLYTLIQEIGAKESNYLYSWAWDSDVFKFPSQVFGGPNVKDSVHPFLWITVLTSINAYLQGMVMFKWAPQIKIKPLPDQTDEQKQQAEALEKSQIFIGIYFTPILYLIINYNLPIGLNIYLLTSTTVTLLRILFVSFYYRNHTKELIKQMDETDPDESDIYVAELEGKTITSRDSLENIVDVEAKIKPRKVAAKKSIKKKKK